MINLLQHCSDTFEDLNYCKGANSIRDCFDCTQAGFYGENQDTYDCLKKLCVYTMNYGPIYVSEIYHFLTESQLLERYFSNFARPSTPAINILSLGCGFGPDDIALNKYRNDNNLHLNFNYTGLDIEPYWNHITQTNALPHTYNILNGLSLQGFHIIFLNKVFSTLKRHGLNNNFLRVFKRALIDLPIGSFVVFNDINNNNMGRDEFHSFAINNSLNGLGNYFFPIDKAYNCDYTTITRQHNICNIPDGLSWSPKPDATKAVFFLYRKALAQP